jgi:DNA-binding MarR family transcriptional regulator
VADSSAQSESDALLDLFDRASRVSAKVLLRWLTKSGVPLLSACVLVTLDPEETPVTVAEVAEAIGLSTDDAHRALHELRSAGYAHEENRQYVATDEGTRLHAALTSARRNAIADFLSGLDEQERRALAAAASS